MMEIERASKQEKKAKIQGQEGPSKQANKQEKDIYMIKIDTDQGLPRQTKQARYTQRRKET